MPETDALGCSELDHAAPIAEALLERMTRRVLRGSIRLYGQWLGGKPLDNLYTVADVRAAGDVLEVTFDLRERLLIAAPRRAAYREGHETGIPVAGWVLASADSVEWAQYAYTHPQRYTDDLYGETRFEPVGGQPAAEFLWYDRARLTPSASARP